MPWIDPPPPPCQHRARPLPSYKDEGRVWKCDDCGVSWRAIVVDHGHDVMPGELQAEPQWELTKR